MSLSPVKIAHNHHHPDVCMSAASLSPSPLLDGQSVDLNMSKHAKVRCQQRGIKEEWLACLLQYGRRQHDHRGGEIVYLSNNGQEAISRYEGHHWWSKMLEVRSL